MAFLFEIAQERADCRQLPHQRAAADADRPPCGHERAEIGGFQPAEIGVGLRRQKGQKLPDVAAIGLEGFR